MSGTLYLVATPIGNLGDLSPRGVQTLQEADFIAAEDTRVSMKLLNHFDIKKPLVSYHDVCAGDGRRDPCHQRSRRGSGAAVRGKRRHGAGHPRLLRRRVRSGGVGAAHRAVHL